MLKNVIKYSKGHFPRNEIISDLIEMLKLDGYTPEDYNHVYWILKKQYLDLAITNNVKESQKNIDVMVSEIHENKIWVHGYITKGNCHLVNYKPHRFPKYNYKIACIYYFLSFFRFLDKETCPEFFNQK